VLSPTQRPLPTEENITQKDEDKYDLSGIGTQDLNVQAIKAYALDCAATGSGIHEVQKM
jgi:hypothetical protein